MRICADISRFKLWKKDVEGNIKRPSKKWPSESSFASGQNVTNFKSLKAQDTLRLSRSNGATATNTLVLIISIMIQSTEL